MIKEVQLHAFWKHHAKAIQNFKTVDGKTVIILAEGTYNTNQGPDFLNAYLEMDGLHWFGSIEFHVKTSDWFLHRHQHDLYYKPVILHVVWENDSTYYSHSPIVELKNLLAFSHFLEYDFLTGSHDLPCFNRRGSHDMFKSYVSNYSITRLNERVDFFLNQFDLHKSWNQVCWIRFCKILGSVQNGEAFSLMAESIPYPMLSLVKYDLQALRAVLLVQSGLIESMDVKSTQSVLETHTLYSQKMGLHLPKLRYQYLRMRPKSMPNSRMNYLIQLLYKHPQLIDCLSTISSENDWNVFLLSQKWQLSNLLLQLILINLVIPLCLTKSKLYKTDFTLSDAIRWMDRLSSESNSIVNRFKDLGVSIQNASQSQGILELYKQKCEKKHCFGCPRFN